MKADGGEPRGSHARDVHSIVHQVLWVLLRNGAAIIYVANMNLYKYLSLPIVSRRFHTRVHI